MNAYVAALESSFPDTRKSLLRMLKYWSGCGDTAEELVQETYLRAIQQDPSAEIGNLSAYLFRIARNLAIDHGRRASFAEQLYCDLPDDDEGGGAICLDPSPEAIVETGQQLDILNQFIAELPPQCRRIFLLHKDQHLSHAEIAERLQISPRTVETQIRKALKTLRTRMGTL